MKKLWITVICTLLTSGLHAQRIEIIRGRKNMTNAQLRQEIERLKNPPFELYNQADVTFYVQVGNTFEKTDKFLIINPGERLWATQNITWLAYSLIENPSYAEDVQFFVFNPEKTVYIQLSTVLGKYKLTHQARLGSSVIGKLKSETISGLSLKDNVWDRPDRRDILWLPCPFLPWDNSLFQSIRDTLDRKDTITGMIDKDSVNTAVMGGWTPLHEVAMWHYDQLINYFYGDLKALNSPNIYKLTPAQLQQSAGSIFPAIQYYSAILIGHIWLPEIKPVLGNFEKALDVYIKSLENDELADVPTDDDINTIHQLLSILTAAYNSIGETYQKELHTLIDSVGKIYTKLIKYIWLPKIKSVLENFEEALDVYIQSLENNELADVPTDDDINTMHQLLSILTAVYNSIGETYREELRTSIGALSSTVETIYNKIFSINNRFLPMAYDEFESSLNHNLYDAQPSEFYKHIGFNKDKRYEIDQQDIINKINEEIKKVGSDSDIGRQLRQFHYVFKGYKDFYDAYLGGREAYEQYNQSLQPIHEVLQRLHDNFKTNVLDVVIKL